MDNAAVCTADVLIVEDNPINQLLTLELLAMMGIEARLATDGVEALAACKDAAPDLVLMDIMMPRMDGLECTRQLRRQQQEGTLQPFPILALSAQGLADDISASHAAGVDGHLTKPIDFRVLRGNLERWLKLPPMDPGTGWLD